MGSGANDSLPLRVRRRVGILLRSMGVGAAATAVDFGLLALLVSGFGLPPRVASAPALALGIAAQFVGNKLVAFRDHSRAWLRQGAQFLAVEALGFAANLVLYDLAMRWLSGPYLLVRLVTTNVVYFGLCLPLWTRIFRPSPPGGATACARGARLCFTTKEGRA